MSLISLVVVLIVVGVLLWAVNQIEQIDPKVKKIINILVIVVVVLWVASQILGGFGNLGAIRIGR